MTSHRHPPRPSPAPGPRHRPGDGPWLRLGALLAAFALVVGACAEDPNGPGASPGHEQPAQETPATTLPPDTEGTDPPDPGPTPDEGEPGAGEFVNPVIERNFADPDVILVDGTYYGYATGNLTYNIQVATSDDLVTWSRSQEALPRLPIWQPSAAGLSWAPEVIETSAGYVMHYSARHVQSGLQCLSIAIADDPAGPFVDESTEPLLCQWDIGGSIDSHPFRDEDGTLYLFWKNDGNCCGFPTWLWYAELSEDGTEVVGEPENIGLELDQGWERPKIEAPYVFLHDGTYYLFYSGGHYNTETYAVGVATSDSIHGPWEKLAENPVLSSRGVAGGPPGLAAGPGHNTVVVDADGDPWIVYHAWDSGLIGDQLGGRRAMWVDRLELENGSVVVHGPTRDPQPAPAAP
jgi:beta-xylosidase